MFGVIATSGILPWYYEEVSLIFVDGATKLEKVYGVLHPLYMIYLIGYFTAMVVCIIQSIKLKMIASQKHATLMAAIVFGNIAVWLVEKFIPWDFEFLSVSYLFSEVIFLGLYWMMQDYVRTDLLPEQEIVIEIKNSDMPIEEKTDMVISMLNPKEPLSAREREILGYVILNKRRREIAEQMYLSENTVKSYTRTLYTKLGVSSREEILDLIK
jgi:DNA-binding CsgD family transcriptional regulator